MGIPLGTAEVTSPRFVPEKTIHDALQVHSPLKPSDLKGRFVEIEETLDQEGVILSKPGLQHLPTAPTATEFTGAGITQMYFDEISRLHGSLDILHLSQSRTGTGKGRNHQTIPSTEDLVIQMRSGSSGAYFKKDFLRSGKRLHCILRNHTLLFHDHQHIFSG